MKALARLLLLLCPVFAARGAAAQMPQIHPQMVTESDLGKKICTIHLAPRFITAIHLPEDINSVAVGDPSEFQVEHSDHEPKIVFIKATTMKAAETNLFVSMSDGQQVSMLLVSQGEEIPSDPIAVDFLVRYESAKGGFFRASSGFPSALVGETVPVPQIPAIKTASVGRVPQDFLGSLLAEQEKAILPALSGSEHAQATETNHPAVRAGVSRVIDGGDEVIVLFSAVNPLRHAILLMPPQVQLNGEIISGKFFHRRRQSTAEQLPVLDFRLSKRRLGAGERADGVALFERPPYKRSSETLLLQIAASGAVDHPVLVPIGFGIGATEDHDAGAN